MTTMPPFEYVEWLDLEAEGLQLKPDAPVEVRKAFEEWKRKYKEASDAKGEIN